MERRPEDTHISPKEPAAKIDKVEDKKISRGFWRHVIIGYAIGMAVAAVIFVLLLFTMSNMELQIPIIFVIAALAQIGTGGGLVGAGIYVSRMTERDDDDDDPPGGKKEPVTAAYPKGTQTIGQKTALASAI